ncbi:MAG: K(+)-stimulated pyrophosphate-energized sodium pump [Bacteroidota bacterium]|nr:K(+)-stimulated pyrophosphate-energized sodium pump [Bacteroidota bacterium]
MEAFFKKISLLKGFLIAAGMLLFLSPSLFAGEESLIIPTLQAHQTNLLYFGLLICVLGMVFGIYQFLRVKSLKAHKSMLDTAQIIYETCKAYLVQQGKFLIILEIFIGICIIFYFGVLRQMVFSQVLLILAWSVVGILGSYSVAWFGIRMNTLANGRMAFASLERKPIRLFSIPIDAGISIGVLLVCVELIMMLIILLFVPREVAGFCFIGFAIGESLGASALRIAGGIFTKIADIGADLMKIVFNLEEDDPRNPGVIADCTGDNAGDGVGPTADGFETYGVTGVALISFIILGVFPQYQAELITWIFVMRILMIATSIVSFWLTKGWATAAYGKKDDIDFEKILTALVWVTSILSIAMTFAVSYWQLANLPNNLWLTLSIIISCGTLAAALIPEFTKIFTSTKARHTQEVVTASREGGASLTILSGIVSGNFSAFWIGLVIVVLMYVAYVASNSINVAAGVSFMIYPSIFAFGLVAFGFLGMGPVNIAVDSYGPVTDNAQSIYELSLIEKIPNITKEIERDFGFTPDFNKSKDYLEANDAAGNTFKATAKPVLIGTAVVGATTMIFSLILVLKNSLQLTDPALVLNFLNPYSLLGLMCGGMVVYWFSGASMQAVTTGAYKAVEYIKKNISLDADADMAASVEKSKNVVTICTQYAQKGMYNIFFTIFTLALAFAFFSASSPANPYPAAFFISYLISIAVFGLFQAIYMANAGGCWDNAKKLVEVDLKEKGTPLHAACVIGDTVGDPFKDTSSVALNPIIKFTTLFGLLAMEIAVQPNFVPIAPYVGGVFFIIALFFIYRSFYSMRIPQKK